MNTTPTPIAQAVRLLRAAAKDIKDCHTRGNDDWTGEPEALAAHDEHLAAAQALELIEQPGDDLSKRLIAACRHDMLTWEDRKAVGEAIALLQSATPAQLNALRDLLNRRPAINAGLAQEYALWNAQCYRVMGAQAKAAANDARPQEDAPAALMPAEGEVLVVVSGFTGSGKSAVAGEIEIMCRALGLQVEWPDGAEEKGLTGADWQTALEMYKPRVRIVEKNVRAPAAEPETAP